VLSDVLFRINRVKVLFFELPSASVEVEGLFPFFFLRDFSVSFAFCQPQITRRALPFPGGGGGTGSAWVRGKRLSSFSAPPFVSSGPLFCVPLVGMHFFSTSPHVLSPFGGTMARVGFSPTRRRERVLFFLFFLCYQLGTLSFRERRHAVFSDTALARSLFLLVSRLSFFLQ